MRKCSLLLGLTVAVLGLACAGPRADQSRAVGFPPTRPLTVGTNAESPPYAFYRGADLVGLEVDFANELGRGLGRPVVLVNLAWDELFDALATGRVDLVMAGVTVTREREVRFAFADRYLQSSLAAAVRRQDRKRFASRAAVCESPINTGVVAATTGEKRLRSRCPDMVARLYPTARDAVRELRENRIDAVVHDAPVLAWYVSENETELDFMPLDKADEPLAWMFRSSDVELRGQANDILAHMRGDGTLDRIVAKWIPAGARGR